MGNVILGAAIGAAVGLLIGCLPSYDYSWEIVQPGSSFTLRLNHLLHPLSMMIGAGAGSIVGAIAGRVAADPNSVPLPRWVWITLVVIVLLLALIGAVYFFLPNRPLPARGPVDADHQQSDGPVRGQEQRAPDPQPPAKGQPGVP